MAATEGKLPTKTTFHAVSTSDTIDADIATDSDMDDQIQQLETVTETAKQAQFQKLKDAQDDTFTTDSEKGGCAQDPFLPSHPPNLNTPRIPKSIDIYNTGNHYSGHSITNGTNRSSLNSLKIPTTLTNNTNGNATDVYEQQLIQFEHGLEALSSIGVISALIFASAFNLWYEFDDELFEDDQVSHAFFSLFLAISIVLSGMATSTMTAHYYTWRIKHQLLSLRVSKQGFEEYLEYLYRTSFIRQLSRTLAVCSFITLYIALAIYGYAKFIISNEFKWSFYISCVGVIIPGSIFTVLAVINVLDGRYCNLFGCCGNKTEGQDLVVFMSGTLRILQKSRMILDGFERS